MRWMGVSSYMECRNDIKDSKRIERDIKLILQKIKKKLLLFIVVMNRGVVEWILQGLYSLKSQNICPV